MSRYVSSPKLNNIQLSAVVGALSVSIASSIPLRNWFVIPHPKTENDPFFVFNVFRTTNVLLLGTVITCRLDRAVVLRKSELDSFLMSRLPAPIPVVFCLLKLT